MDHQETREYMWPGEFLKYIRPLGDTTAASPECLNLKKLLDKKCGKFAMNHLKLILDPIQKKIKTISPVIARSAHPFILQAKISDERVFYTFLLKCEIYATSKPIQMQEDVLESQ